MTKASQNAQVMVFDDIDVSQDDDEFLFDELLEDEEYELDLSDLLGFEEVPILLVDTDPERAVERQREMMEVCFGGIGEEKKAEKRMGLAMQQLDVEQRHALRLLLIYQDAGALTKHLVRSLEDPEYGYGERGYNGRTIAQAMAAFSGDDLAGIVTEWLTIHRDFQQNVLAGEPFNFRSLFDFADIDTFVPLVKRVGDMSWLLGVEGEGKHVIFQGDIGSVWPQLCDTFVAWCDDDNQAWLSELKGRVSRMLPQTMLRAARADRLRKETHHVEVEHNQVTLRVVRDGQGWPRTVVLGDQVGLSRLSGHSFFELAWNGGLNVRRFEISGKTIKKVSFEHIEQALCMAEVLAGDQGIVPEPVTPLEVEAAYLRRLKAKRAEVLPPQGQPLPGTIRGKAVVIYRVNNILATIVHGDPETFAYITGGENKDRSQEQRGVLLFRDDRQDVMAAVPVERGRPMRGHKLMTTPLAPLDLHNGDWLRALCSWGAWLFDSAVGGQ